MKLSAKTVKVVRAKLGYDAGVIGAATLVLYELRGTNDPASFASGGAGERRTTRG
jgi:hypothetical protein